MVQEVTTIIMLFIIAITTFLLLAGAAMVGLIAYFWARHTRKEVGKKQVQQYEQPEAST